MAFLHQSQEWSLWVALQELCLWHSAVYESKNRNFVWLQTHGHKRFWCCPSPDGQTSTVYNRLAFLRIFLSCVSTKPIANDPCAVLRVAMCLCPFLQDHIITVENFWELEVILCVVRQTSLLSVKGDKRWILYAFTWTAIQTQGSKKGLSILGTLDITETFKWLKRLAKERTSVKCPAV